MLWVLYASMIFDLSMSLTILADPDNASTTSERARMIVKINESWIRDIIEAIQIRDNQLEAAYAL